MRVLISGAGIAGPTLAYFLAKIDADITVVEKSPHLLTMGQNIDISGSARKVIRKMGLEAEVLRHNTTEKGTEFIGPDGRAFAPFVAGKGPTSEWEILRGDLASILYDATKDLPNVKYILGQTVELDGDDVRFSDGRVDRFDVVVAADGQWSRIRRKTFDDVTVRDFNEFCAYWTAPRTNEDSDWWRIHHALGSRVITTRPDPYGTLRTTFSHMPLNDESKKEWETASRSDRATQIAFLKSQFKDVGWFAPRMLEGLDQADDLYFQSVQQIRMPRWYKGRVVCLGDAGYAPTPLTGMGTSLAITGAYILAGELSQNTPDKAFSAYDTIFRPFVEKTQNVPSFIPGIAHPKGAWGRWTLQWVITIASAVISIPLVAKLLISADKEDFHLPSYPKLDKAVQV